MTSLDETAVAADAPAAEAQPERVARKLRTAILHGAFPDGRINELKLSEQLGVSRTPIRNALQSLAGEGLVEYVRNRGFRVRAFPVSEILDAFEMRAMAEGLAARLAAERGLTVADEREMEAALAEGDNVLALDDLDAAREIFSRSNDRFHSVLERASRSRLVADVIGLCHRVPQTFRGNVMAFELADVAERQRQHHGIYQAVLMRRPTEAEALMLAHVLGVKRAIARHFDSGNPTTD